MAAPPVDLARLRAARLRRKLSTDLPASYRRADRTAPPDPLLDPLPALPGSHELSTLSHELSHEFCTCENPRGRFRCENCQMLLADDWLSEPPPAAGTGLALADHQEDNEEDEDHEDHDDDRKEGRR